MEQQRSALGSVEAALAIFCLAAGVFVVGGLFGATAPRTLLMWFVGMGIRALMLCFVLGFPRILGLCRSVQKAQGITSRAEMESFLRTQGHTSDLFASKLDYKRCRWIVSRKIHIGCLAYLLMAALYLLDQTAFMKPFATFGFIAYFVCGAIVLLCFFVGTVEVV